mgnify:CR=1 FL=1
MTKEKSQIRKNNWIWILAAVIIVVIAIIALRPGTGTGRNSLPATINVTEAADRFAQGAYLLDVREQVEWEEAHVEGAVLIPLGELSTRLDELPTDEDILVICRSGNRSAQARDLLRQAGFERVTSISGGINAWMAAGLPVVSGN